jgi:hypothetical protein
LLNERAFLDFLLNEDLALKRADVLRIEMGIFLSKGVVNAGSLKEDCRRDSHEMKALEISI